MKKNTLNFLEDSKWANIVAIIHCINLLLMYVPVYVYKYVCVYVRIYVSRCVCMYVCMYVYR